MVCKEDLCCAGMILWFAGMIKGETEGGEATRAVVEAAKAVAGETHFVLNIGNMGRRKQMFYLQNVLDMLTVLKMVELNDLLVAALAAAAEENIEVTTVVSEVQARLQVCQKIATNK